MEEDHREAGAFKWLKETLAPDGFRVRGPAMDATLKTVGGRSWRHPILSRSPHHPSLPEASGVPPTIPVSEDRES